jgi:CO dehydrogenase nickel-insertion accessory protein CooC1
MSTDRYVVLGVAQVRSPWFREVARWSTSAMLPIEFVKSMSLEEVRVRLRAGRGYSALLVDDSLAGLDRDVVELARDAGCAVIVVEGGRARRAWVELGASAVLPASFAREELLQVLVQVATPIARSTAVSGGDGAPAVDGHRGRLVAVTGGGGTGASTVAAAIAQGLAHDPRNLELVCLADLALHAEQAMLHGAADVVPGVIELVESHRGGAPSVEEVRRLTWQVTDRRYHLLLGLRRHRDWTAVRPRAFSAALDGLRRAFQVVVADVDADLEGERSTGSVDVEERNVMARTTVLAADLVVVVGLPGMKGLHTLLGRTRDVLAHGVPATHVLAVVNRAPKGPRARAELTAAYAALLEPVQDDLAGPLFLAERRHLDEVLRDGARLPDVWFTPVAGSVQAILDRSRDRSPAPGPAPVLEPVTPGSIGRWTDHA